MEWASRLGVQEFIKNVLNAQFQPASQFCYEMQCKRNLSGNGAFQRHWDVFPLQYCYLNHSEIKQINFSKLREWQVAQKVKLQQIILTYNFSKVKQWQVTYTKYVAKRLNHNVIFTLLFFPHPDCPCRCLLFPSVCMR